MFQRLGYLWQVFHVFITWKLLEYIWIVHIVVI